MSHTSGAGADAPEGAGAAAAVLLVGVSVAELLGHGAVLQPHLQVGQVPPVGARRQRDVLHTTLDQSTHVLHMSGAPICYPSGALESICSVIVHLKSVGHQSLKTTLGLEANSAEKSAEDTQTTTCPKGFAVAIHYKVLTLQM